MFHRLLVMQKVLRFFSTDNTIQFPSGIESTEEGIPQVIEDKDANNNNNNNLAMCNKLTSLGKVLFAEWQLGKITTEQTMYLGQQIKELDDTRRVY